jgi:hypothetical protein
MIDFDSSDSDDESAKTEQLPSEKPSLVPTDLEQYPAAAQQRLLSSQRASHAHALADEPALFSLQLNVTPLDQPTLDESVDEISLEGDTVPFYTGNPAIQKFKGHVRARTSQSPPLPLDFTSPRR